MNYQIVKDNDGKEYKQYEGGTCYHPETPERVVFLLENNRIQGRARRLRLVYGDTKTGKSWEEQFDVAGYVGRSTGPRPIPILVNNSRSMGGGGILDHCIIGIRYANRKDGGWLYRHPLYMGNE